MNVAVIGAGKVGGALAQKWGAAGHQVTLGARDPGAPQVQQLVHEIEGNARATPISEAAAGAEAVLLAVPGGSVEEVLASVGDTLAGMVVIDATNNLDRARSGGDMNSVAAIAAAAPSASVYRAFNSLGWENFAHPTFGGVNADLFYAGPEGTTRVLVERLIGDVGLRPIRLGGMDKIPLVDAILPLWFALASEQQMGRHLAFKVLTD
ncbi:MAG: NADPH-dependent F420 reductase [Dehalococcoidia bacterium]